METFTFKQFAVQQHQCAMKIGTDGVLLGAWSTLQHKPNTILDIGAGTGVLALMLAQRSAAQSIEAIEIDDAAFEQCAQNFENSPWSDRLFCYHASLLEFVDEVDDTFDSIICNPPFYNTSYKTNNNSRNLARFQDAMPFEHLLYAVTHLLSKTGVFTVVVPYTEESNFLQLVQQTPLQLNAMLHVKGQPNAPVKRSLLQLSFTKTTINTTTLIIETERHKYTKDYIKLTKDFYLKM